jgi:hypothetical protein
MPYTPLYGIDLNPSMNTVKICLWCLSSPRLEAN